MSPNNRAQQTEGETTDSDKANFHNITYSTKDRCRGEAFSDGDVFVRGKQAATNVHGKAVKLWKEIKSTLYLRSQSKDTTILDDTKDFTISGNFTNLYIKPDQCLPKASDVKNNNLGGSLHEDEWLTSSANLVYPHKEVNRTGKVHRTFTFKVLVIGDPCTGKTSMIHRYVAGEFSDNYKATLGVDFALKVVRWSDNVTVKLQLWDIAGQERFTSMTRVYYKDAHACVIMFDLTQRSSFLNALRWKKDLDMKCSLPDGNPVPCILLANKCDLSNREVKQEEIEGFCQEQEFIGWTETSVKQGLMVEESMRFLLDDMIARYAERNPGLTDSQALDMDRKSNVSLQRASETVVRSGCAC